MLVFAFFHWWYGAGWRDAATRVQAQLARIYQEFSIPTLARTLFQPWRRIVSQSGGALGDKFRAQIDNLVSRLVGLLVRLGTLIAGLVALLITLVVGIIFIILWPLLPLLGPGLILKSFL